MEVNSGSDLHEGVVTIIYKGDKSFGRSAHEYCMKEAMGGLCIIYKKS